jgi:TusA-related sulfurtransferase
LTRAEEITLDVMDLEPPEPFERVTEALGKLEPGQYIRIDLRRRPMLLYPWLAEHGFAEQTRQIDDDVYCILIWSASDPETEKAIDQLSG